MDTLQWFAYKHVNGSFHLKRYFGELSDISVEDAHESPFVDSVTPVFEAETRLMAQIKGLTMLGMEDTGE